MAFRFTKKNAAKYGRLGAKAAKRGKKTLKSSGGYVVRQDGKELDTFSGVSGPTFRAKRGKGIVFRTAAAARRILDDNEPDWRDFDISVVKKR